MFKKTLLSLICVFGFSLVVTAFAAKTTVEVNQAKDDKGNTIKNTVAVTITIEFGERDVLNKCECVEMTVSLYDKDGIGGVFDDSLSAPKSDVLVCATEKQGQVGKGGKISTTVEIPIDSNAAKEADDGNGKFQVYAQVQRNKNKKGDYYIKYKPGGDTGSGPFGMVALVDNTSSSEVIDVNYTPEGTTKDSLSISIGDNNLEDFTFGGNEVPLLDMTWKLIVEDNGENSGNNNLREVTGEINTNYTLNTDKISVEAYTLNGSSMNSIGSVKFTGGNSWKLELDKDQPINFTNPDIALIGKFDQTSVVSISQFDKGLGGILAFLFPLGMLLGFYRKRKLLAGLFLASTMFLIMSCTSTQKQPPQNQNSTYQLTVTKINAVNISTGESLEVEGLPLVGPTVTIQN